MKPLRELKATYGSNDIADLVDFTRQAPVELPEGKYHFEKDGATVHVYGVERGIDQYNIGALAEGTSLQGVKKTSSGVEIGLTLGGVEKIILHAKMYQGTTPKPRRKRRESTSSSGESRGTTGESRLSGYSRSSYSGGESRGGGESR